MSESGEPQDKKLRTCNELCVFRWVAKPITVLPMVWATKCYNYHKPESYARDCKVKKTTSKETKYVDAAVSAHVSKITGGY